MMNDPYGDTRAARARLTDLMIAELRARLGDDHPVVHAGPYQTTRLGNVELPPGWGYGFSASQTFIIVRRADGSAHTLPISVPDLRRDTVAHPTPKTVYPHERRVLEGP